MPKGKRINASDALLLRAGYTATGNLRGSGYRDIKTGYAASYSDVAEAVAKIQAGAKELAAEIITQLEAKTPATKLKITKPFEDNGKMFTMRVSAPAVISMQNSRDAAKRMEVISRSRSFVMTEVRSDMSRILPHLQSTLRMMIENIMDEMVYDAEDVEVIYYDPEMGGRLGTGYEGRTKRQSGNLKRAAIEGLRLTGTEISWEIDDNIAPYWLWVDQGHRVFLPDGEGGTREIGVWVRGRKFVHKIEMALKQVSDSLTAVMNHKYKGVVTAIGQWVLHGKHMLDKTNYMVVHYPDEFDGYTKAFYQHVGEI